MKKVVYCIWMLEISLLATGCNFLSNWGYGPNHEPSTLYQPGLSYISDSSFDSLMNSLIFLYAASGFQCKKIQSIICYLGPN